MLIGNVGSFSFGSVLNYLLLSFPKAEIIAYFTQYFYNSHSARISHFGCFLYFKTCTDSALGQTLKVILYAAGRESSGLHILPQFSVIFSSQNLVLVIQDLDLPKIFLSLQALTFALFPMQAKDSKSGF